jgi:hypothetical protein
MASGNACPYCDKTYIKTTTLNKHMVTCEYLNKSKQNKKIHDEAIKNQPTYNELVIIVQELATKLNKMEDKVKELEKIAEPKKKKLNVIEWLNAKVSPMDSYVEWVNKIIISITELNYLFENNIFQTVAHILQERFQTRESTAIPIYAFHQKANHFYIYTGEEWREMGTTDIVHLFKHLQNKFMREMSIWYAANKDQVYNNDKTSEMYNTTIIKIMSISLEQDAAFSKMKTQMYNDLKVDIKHLVEVQIHF